MSRNKQPLAEELGEGYMNEFFRGALFKHEGKVCMVRSCGSRDIIVSTLDPNQKSLVWGQETLPSSLISSFKDVAWPKLGYRNYKHTKIGNIVDFVSCQRSVLRGIRTEHLNHSPLSVCECLDVAPFSGTGAGSDKYRILQLFFPQWFSYKEGINKIKENKIPAFALNEDMAIGLSMEPGNKRFCDVFFREKIVGNIDDSGEIMIANKVMKKRHLSRLYTMMEQ